MKRFKLGYSGKLHSSEIYCDNELMITTDVVDLLNALHEENERLKEEIKDLNDVLARYEEKELKE